LAVVSLNASAFDPYPDFTFTPSGGGMAGAFSRGSASAWTAGTKTPTSTGMMFSSASKTLPFDPPTTGAFKALFTPKSMARAMTAGAAVAIPLLAAPALSYLLAQACVRAFGGSLTLEPGGQWEECHYTSHQGTTYKPNDALGNAMGSTWFPDYTSAAQYGVSTLGTGTCTVNGTSGPTSYALNTSLTNSTQWVAAETCSVNGNVNQTRVTRGYHTQTGTIKEFDGYAPVDAVQAQADIEAALNDQAAKDVAAGVEDPVHSLQAVLNDLYAAGQPVDGTLQAPDVQTPVMKAGPTTTTQNSDGTSSTATTTQKSDYSCIVIQNGQALQCSQVTTTTTTTTATDPAHPASSPASSTTMTTTATDPAKQQDECAANPKRIGCSEYGTPTVDPGDALKKETKTITFTPVSFQGGACPSPVTFYVFGKGYEFSYDLLCSKLQLISVILLVLAGAMAAYIFADGFRV
jgi:hypothetical protein